MKVHSYNIDALSSQLQQKYYNYCYNDVCTQYFSLFLYLFYYVNVNKDNYYTFIMYSMASEKIITIRNYLVDMCIGCRRRFLNGRHRRDYWGKFTCFTPRGCSVVDYVIVSAGLYDKVADFSVGELPKFSDHCPLKLAI